MSPRRPRRLSVWLDGHHVATLDERATRKMRLTYQPAVVENHPQRPVLSLSMPVRAQPYSPGLVGPWADNLLPEGPTRLALARGLHARASDTYALLAEVGRDCAGAVMFLPDEETPQRRASTLRALTTAEVEDLVNDLPRHPLGLDFTGQVRLSLAGTQEKLLLARLADGRWARPLGGAASTHILKPEPAGYPGLAVAELFALEWARAAGLDACRAEVVSIAGRPVIAVRRYDRMVVGAGQVRRPHQEDACQALGHPPENKYEADGGPSLREIADLLHVYATRPVAELRKLLQYLVFTAALGNADAHGKNVSFLLGGPVRLAPLYDVVPTSTWDLSTEAGMFANQKQDIDAWRRADLVAEAVSWRMPLRVATILVDNTLARLAETLDATAQRVGVPVEVAVLVRGRTARLLDT